MLELLLHSIWGFNENKLLDSLAYERACIVSEQRSHDGLKDLLHRSGYKEMGENIALDFYQAHLNDFNILSAWINSPSHHKVLQYQYTEMGVGRCNSAVVLLLVK